MTTSLGYLSGEDLADPIIKHHFGGRHDFLVVPASLSDLGARIVAGALADLFEARSIDFDNRRLPTLARLAACAEGDLRELSYGEDYETADAAREQWLDYDRARGL